MELEQMQINGQKRLGPPKNWVGPAPEDAEIYVKNLPNDVLEIELYNLFRPLGDIYQIRVPVHWTGLNKGYAFIRFVTSELASLAVHVLAGREVRRGRKIHVEKSWDNCRLYLSCVPKDMSGEDIMEALSDHVDGIVKVFAYRDELERGLFRGYAFLQFRSHRTAAVARRTLTRELFIELFGKPSLVAWAKQEQPQQRRQKQQELQAAAATQQTCFPIGVWVNPETDQSTNFLGKLHCWDNIAEPANISCFTSSQPNLRSY